MSDEAELPSASLKEALRSVSDDNSASYKVVLKKLHRLAQGNVRTRNAVARRMGIEVLTKKAKLPSFDFITYDGEGWANKYILLANSLGERITNLDGLSSRECLGFLAQRYDRRIVRTFFSFSYDVNHILRDVPDEQLKTLLEGRIIDYEGYRIQYVPGKIFSINNITYYDVFGFFQTSFLNVIKTMLGENAVTDKLIEGKEARGTFETWPLERIIEYNDEELQLLVQVLNKLRQAFEDIDVHLKEWYGPGAVAKYWFRKYGINLKEQYTADALSALSKAYYGGRFEQITLGRVAPVYEYDIHSAYPSAMADMPYFTGWKRVQKYRDDPFSIWHVSFDFREDVKNGYNAFFPLPMRSRDGRICFPVVGKGWYWQRELEVALRHFPRAKITFHAGYVATTEGEPFAWIKSLYEYRAELKRNGNLAHYAIKVGLNSLYGKTAQRIGRNQYFSLAWAGYITSTTRAKLADAGFQQPNSIIGFATDALFSTRPLGLPITDNLGDWEFSRFDSGTFFQSGVYRLLQGDIHTDRYRGAPLRRGIDDIIKQLEDDPFHNPKIKVGRFISHLLAIRAPRAYNQYRLSFVQVQHELALDAPYKRHYLGFLVHLPDGTIVPKYGKLLTETVQSIPKIWVDDDTPFAFSEYLYGNIKVPNVESYPPPIKDSTLQRLIEEGVIVASENYDEVESLSELPVVVEEAM